MSEDRERYALIGTWVEVFREEGVDVSDYLIRRRLKVAGIIGKTARNRVGRLIQNGFYAESDVHQACFDLLNPSEALDFNDPEKVKADLINFAAELGEGKTPLDLSTANIISLSITCQNGQVMKGATYLRSAALALGFARSYHEAKFAQMLKHLINVAGFNILDETYFGDSEKVKADLFAFASQLNEDGVPLDLSTHNVQSLSITCQTGQIMTGDTYLNIAAKTLGFAKTTREASCKQAYTLKHLLKVADFDLLDEAYFHDSEKVKADLIAFATQLGEDKTPLDLNSSNLVFLSIACQNGQMMKGITYCRTAARMLGFAKDAKEAASKQLHTLRYLLKTVGYEISEYTPHDKAYFQDSNKVKADLIAFAKKLGHDKTPLDLKVNSSLYSISITCQSGELIKGEAYLRGAAEVLGFSGRSQALKHLLKVAGFDLLDEAYFHDSEKVKADLIAYAAQLGEGKTPLDLYTRNFASFSITCQNGQLKKGATYLNTAAKAMSLAKDTKEASSKLAQTLRTLKETAGYLTKSND